MLCAWCCCCGSALPAPYVPLCCCGRFLRRLGQPLSPTHEAKHKRRTAARIERWYNGTHRQAHPPHTSVACGGQRGEEAAGVQNKKGSRANEDAERRARAKYGKRRGSNGNTRVGGALADRGEARVSDNSGRGTEKSGGHKREECSSGKSTTTTTRTRTPHTRAGREVSAPASWRAPPRLARPRTPFHGGGGAPACALACAWVCVRPRKACMRRKERRGRRAAVAVLFPPRSVCPLACLVPALATTAPVAPRLPSLRPLSV